MCIYRVSILIYMPHMKLLPLIMQPELLSTGKNNIYNTNDNAG